MAKTSMSQVEKLKSLAFPGEEDSLLDREIFKDRDYKLMEGVLKNDLGIELYDGCTRAEFVKVWEKTFKKLVIEKEGNCLFLNAIERDDLLNIMAQAFYRKYKLNLTVKMLCLLDLYFLAKCILGYRDMTRATHLPICRHLQENLKNCLVIMPRGFYKTTISTKSLSIWLIINDKNIRILIANATATNAEAFLKEIKSHFESNPRFKGLFKELVPTNFKDMPWSSEKMQVIRTERWSEPTIRTTGIEGNVTGMHFNCIIEDDLVNEDHITSPEMMQKPIDWHKMSPSLYVPTDDSGKKMNIVVGTRWSYYDFINYIMTECPDYKKHEMSCFDKRGESTFPEKYSTYDLTKIRDAMGPYLFACLPYDAPILMDDWSLKPIGEIKVGEVVKGWIPGTNKKKAKMVSSKVLATNESENYLKVVTLKSGNKIICTEDHKWQVRKNYEKEGSHKYYNKAKVGRKLRKVLQINNEQSNKKELWAYLSGIIDGEGSVKHGNLQIHQSDKKNPDVCRRIEKVLDELNITYNPWNRKPYFDKRNNTNHNSGINYILSGGRQLKFDLVNYGMLAKRNDLIKSMELHCRHMCEDDEVISIDDYKPYTKWHKPSKHPVYNIQTETGNYIAYGYASKNCQFMNQPTPGEIQVFKKEWIKYYDELSPDVPYRKYLLIDPAVSEKKDADNRAAVVVAVNEALEWFVLEYSRGVFPLTSDNGTKNLVSEIFRLHMTYQPEWVGVEESGFQAAMSHLMRGQFEARKYRFNINRMIPRGKQTKAMRIESLAAPFAAGRVFIKKEMKELEDELLGYPMARYRDLIDALSYLVQYEVPPSEPIVFDDNPFLMANILKELKNKRGGMYPFREQVRARL